MLAFPSLPLHYSLYTKFQPNAIPQTSVLAEETCAFGTGGLCIGSQTSPCQPTPGTPCLVDVSTNIGVVEEGSLPGPFLNSVGEHP